MFSIISKRSPLILVVLLFIVCDFYVTVARINNKVIDITSNNDDEAPNWYPTPNDTNLVIQNDLTEGHVLTLHCMFNAGGVDFGTEHVPYNKFYTFTFTAVDSRTTLMLCDFTWRNGRAVYDAFDVKRDEGRYNRTLTWRARFDGMHGFNEIKGVEDLFFPWKN